MSDFGSIGSERDFSGIPPLEQLYFYLTEGCNLACRHCWLAPKHDPNGSRYASVPAELFEKIIDEAIPLGLKGVKLTGGEPLLHPEITRLLRLLRQRDLRLTLESNGLLCTPSVAAEIARSHNPFVSISLDGVDAETHDWVRGVLGSFQSAMEGLTNLAQAGVETQIISAVMRRNADQLESIIQLAEKFGVRSVKFNIVQPIARGEALTQANEALSIEELIELGHLVDRHLSSQTQVELHFDLPAAFRPLSRMARVGGRNRCAIETILGVLPDGSYSLCGIGENIPELIFGHARRDSLSKLWHNNLTLNGLRDGLPEKLEGICAQCLMKKTCRGSCLAQNFYQGQSLFAPFWFCAAADRTGLFPESRKKLS
jgi:SynChlorMet cassette radical SAM/SPASM protein ScmF